MGENPNRHWENVQTSHRKATVLTTMPRILLLLVIIIVVVLFSIFSHQDVPSVRYLSLCSSNIMFQWGHSGPATNVFWQYWGSDRQLKLWPTMGIRQVSVTCNCFVLSFCGDTMMWLRGSPLRAEPCNGISHWTNNGDGVHFPIQQVLHSAVN